MRNAVTFRQVSYVLALLFAGSLFLAGCAGSEAVSLPGLSTAGSQVLAVEGSEIESDGESAVAESPFDSEAEADPAEPSQAGQQDEGLDELYQGLPVGFTDEGFPYRGQADAPVTLIEYSDYLCPFCGRYFTQTQPALLESYGESGQVRFVFRDLPLTSLHPTAPTGHAAALCAAEQSAALFWAMHDQLFATQQQWSALADPADFVAGLAESSGVDMRAYDTCMAAADVAARVDESVAAGLALGFNGTPSFQVVVNESGNVHTLVGAQPVQVFGEMLDALIAGEELPQPEEPEAAELPFWANAEGLVPDPDRPGYTLAGDPYKGNPEAELVVVEFSDFQCPACAQHALEIQPALDQSLVDTGEIMWVFKPLPLEEHSQALPAAVAAECAGEQERFWEMHHSLFANVDDWAVEDVDARIAALAGEEGLDMAAFEACYEGREALERVVGDMYDAQGTAQMTPTFIALYNGRGTLINGSRPVDNFTAVLRNFLQPPEQGGS